MKTVNLLISLRRFARKKVKLIKRHTTASTINNLIKQTNKLGIKYTKLEG